MSILIWNSGLAVLDDFFTPSVVKNTEADAGTRHMIVNAASVEDAVATVTVGSTLPSHSSMFCLRGRARPRVCGKIYECEFDYAGLWSGSAKRSIAVTKNLEGWDSGTEIRIVAAATQEDARGVISVGSNASEYSFMFYTTSVAEPVVEGHCYKVTAALKGISWDRPVRWVVRGYAEKQGMKLAVYPGQSTPVPLESNQALMGATAFWVSVSGAPDCSVTGTNVDPDFSPGVPDNIWSLIPNPVHVYPFGWVLETREPDIIPGTGVCLVKDQYVYYQHFKPGDS